MTRILLLAALAALSACTSGPNLGIGIGIGSGGVSVSPAVSGRVGNVGVSVSG